MIAGTTVIVLNYLRYSDNSIIVHALAEDFGRVSFMVQGIGNKRRANLSAFQPLYLLQTQLYIKPTRDIQILKEFKLSPPLHNLATDIRKSTIALFLAELLSKTIREEYPDKHLYQFLTASILILNEMQENISLFPMLFLLKFSRYLGFEPNLNNLNGKYYDYKEGKKSEIKPLHKFYINSSQQNLLRELASLNYAENHSLAADFKARRELFEVLLLMYEIHILNLTSLKSYPIITEVFSG